MAPDAWWVYCVVPADRAVPEGVRGVAGGAPVAIAAGGLAAVAGPVPLSEYGEEPLRANLNDMAWLEHMARAHEGVLEQMLSGGELVPLRVCTIYSDECQVQGMLEERAGLFAEALERLAGRSEWGVKVVLDRARLEERVRTGTDEMRALAADIAGKPEGLAYIARKRLDARVQDEAEQLIAAAVRHLHAQLEARADDSVVLRAQTPELSGHSGEMVLNGAYLVADDDAPSFGVLVHDMRSLIEADGMAIELTGPWPAYNFATRAEGVAA